MSDAWTTRRILEWMTRDFAARGLPGPRLDAELLVAHALEAQRVALYMDLDRPLRDAELSAIRALVQRRRAREPIAYIIGVREFWKRPFEVSTAVLVPRPDTELLVSKALERLPTGPLEVAPRVLDLCTGSGILAVSLAVERPSITVIASDLSPEALAVSARNVARHGVSERVELRQGDLFATVAGEAPFDLIVSNPPYIPSAEIETLDDDVKAHEPRLALDGGADGFDIHRRLVAEAAALLVPGGALLVEVGAGQAPELARLLEATGDYALVETATDFGGIERVVIAEKRGASEG